MRRHLLAAGVLVLLAAALVQPAVAQNETGDTNETAPEEQENETENETEEEESENETEQENKTRGPPDDVPRGESAQFDARLMTAINTVGTLIQIAPNDEARQHLQDALNSLEMAQSATDTASLGSEDNKTEAENQQRQGPPEDRGQGLSNNRGQKGGGPPGFVSNLLGGLF